MDKKAILALEDGKVFEGYLYGSPGTAFGEVVFDTAMTGYEEMLTDPSFAGQIVVPTYPLIGNYGINEQDSESKKVQVSGFVVCEWCVVPSHKRSSKTLHEYLAKNNVPGLYGVDTRALTRHLRSRGVMLGVLTSEMTPNQALEEIMKQPRYGNMDFINQVTAEKAYDWEDDDTADSSAMRIVVLDMGMKYNIARLLAKQGCKLHVAPATADADYILGMKPDGIVLSPGPGDPALLDYITETVKTLVYKKPVMGICLGHQLIGRALGATTYKLKFGHRGGNHPVKDLSTGRIYITTQNHGYAIDASTVTGGLEVSHINNNDGTVEGLKHRDLPVFSIQYHSEGAPGPQDNEYLFKTFLTMVKDGK
ncbi:MAG TPA: carbamoyl phosphate synthase small subunit [Dehalococcoidia bacterium]|nr:carbamoyl phosphate synthase small subunit [Dehalococcoidia bacterium]